MKSLTKLEASNWCVSEGMTVTRTCFLLYEQSELFAFGITLDRRPSRLIAFANQLVPTWRDQPFPGALLWLKEWGLWDAHSEAVGSTILEALRTANGDHHPAAQRPGLLFGPAELMLAHSFFAVPLLFGWDAFLVPAGQGFFIFVSHDDVACVVTREGKNRDELLERVQHWKPQDCRDWYLKGMDGG